MTYETWRRLTWDNPECDRELGTVAVADGAPVGISFLETDRATGRAVNVGTGVIPAFRGRGLGLLMKQVSLTRAAAAGITRVITQNDDTNAPMVAINERLGYRPFSTGHSWVLER
jgi:RimJ/RimL family protein N-acetyltransferase